MQSRFHAIFSSVTAARLNKRSAWRLGACLFAAPLLLGLSACQSSGTKAPEVVAAVPDQAGSAGWVYLKAQEGLYPNENKSLEKGRLSVRLKALLGGSYPTLIKNMVVTGPWTQERGVFYVTGNRPHEGGKEFAAVAVDPQRDKVRVWLVTEGVMHHFNEPGERVTPPTDVQTMVRNLNR